MPNYVPSNLPPQDILPGVSYLPGAGISGGALIPVQQQSLADGSNNLIGGGASNGGPIASWMTYGTPDPYQVTGVITARIVPLLARTTNGPLVDSQANLPTITRLYLSPDGVNFAPVDTRTSRVRSITDHTFKLVDYSEKVMGLYTWFDASGNPLPNPTSQPRTFQGPWLCFSLVITPGEPGDARIVMAQYDGGR